jgi:hypothetical protein
LKQEHAYIIYEVWRCNEATKKAGDPACKPERMMHLKNDPAAPRVDWKDIPEADRDLYEEDLKADSIDNWMRYKKISLKVLNQKIDFSTFDKIAVRYNEIFFPSIPMAYPSYSDTGYRFRYNQFDRSDGYIFPNNFDNKFYDCFEYNTDTWQSAPAGSEQLVAELYFRLEVDQITHSRIVYNFMDFIGDLGGVRDIMLEIAGWLIGSYAAFHSAWATMSALYRVRLPDGNIYQQSKLNDPTNPDLFKIKLPLATRFFLWLNTTMCGCFFKCCMKPNHEKYLELMDAGAEKMEADFDIYEMIQEQKRLRFELNKLKEKNGCANDPDFNGIDEKTIIELGAGEEEGD